MTVFISHAFTNQPEFSNVATWLDHLGVDYWKPSEVRAGEALRDQLREAIASCTVCVFVATHASVESLWCGAELGAFWGAGIPIVTYLADSSLSQDAFPPVVQGDAWERELARVAARAQELDNQMGTPSPSSPAPNTRVGSLTTMQLSSLIASAVSLARAEDKRTFADGGPQVGTKELAQQVVRAADAAYSVAVRTDETWRKQLLWVDDRPENNVGVRDVFESFDIDVELALSTQEALAKLATGQYGAIISDMGRREGPREGYALLDQVRMEDTTTPYFIYAGSGAVRHRREALDRGAQGSTNSPAELVDAVMKALGNSSANGNPTEADF